MTYISLEIYVGLAGLVGFNKLLGCAGFIKKLSGCTEACDLNRYSSTNSLSYSSSKAVSLARILGLNIMTAAPKIMTGINETVKESKFNRYALRCPRDTTATSANNSRLKLFSVLLENFSSNLNRCFAVSSVYRRLRMNIPIMMLIKYGKKAVIIAKKIFFSGANNIYKEIAIGSTKNIPKRIFALNCMCFLISLTGFFSTRNAPFLLRTIIAGFSHLKQRLIADNIYIFRKSKLYV